MLTYLRAKYAWEWAMLVAGLELVGFALLTIASTVGAIIQCYEGYWAWGIIQALVAAYLWSGVVRFFRDCK